MIPLVSVCIPCYNAAPYLGPALDSVLSQSWSNLEVIVVNDGSTDGSADLLNFYRSKGVKVFHQDNFGQCVAANRAWKEASGDYIKFFDADDLMSPNMIELQMSRLKGRENAVASCEWGRFYLDDIASFSRNWQSVWRDMKSADWLVESWYDARPMMQCAIWLIPRAILEKCGGWDESLSLINDFEFFSRVLCHTEEVLFTPNAILYYRSGISGSLSTQKSRKAVESAYQSLIKGTAHLLGKRNDEAARLACANILQDFIYTFYPAHADLRAFIAKRIAYLGGGDLEVDGSPWFVRIKRLIGWKAARWIQICAKRRFKSRN